jgi:hypothetical protein
VPATRRLQGLNSRKANAAATQLNPHANASNTTRSLAVAAVSLLDFSFAMSARYSWRTPAWRDIPAMQICRLQKWYMLPAIA